MGMLLERNNTTPPDTLLTYNFARILYRFARYYGMEINFSSVKAGRVAVLSY
jgi:hypothetical protein